MHIQLWAAELYLLQPRALPINTLYVIACELCPQTTHMKASVWTWGKHDGSLLANCQWLEMI